MARKVRPAPGTNRLTTRPPPRSGCPIAASLDVFGDRWSLLIVRDLLFHRPRGYTEFADGPEGIATNILADRLARLETDGIIVRSPDPDDGRRRVYDLTPKGIALAPVLAEMIAWAALHERTGVSAPTIDTIRRGRNAFVAGLSRDWASGTARPMHPSHGPRRRR